ncbi:MAG: hypothetical protein ACYC0C_09770 [Devosia sp.]
METDLATSLVMARSTATRFSAQVAIVKANREMEPAQMADQAARAAPPPGQGAKVDKLA